MSSSLTLKKITVIAAAEICARFDLTHAAAEKLMAGLPAADYLESLIHDDLIMEGLQFMVYALPKREAVWLACLAARGAPSKTKEDSAALTAVEKWVFEPNAETHQPLKAVAEATGMSTPSGMAAAAGNWADGSLTSVGVSVPPPDGLTPKAVLSAILLAVSQSHPDDPVEGYRILLNKAINIADGGSGY
jgi:hypothetical protein